MCKVSPRSVSLFKHNSQSKTICSFAKYHKMWQLLPSQFPSNYLCDFLKPLYTCPTSILFCCFIVISLPVLLFCMSLTIIRLVLLLLILILSPTMCFLSPHLTSYLFVFFNVYIHTCMRHLYVLMENSIKKLENNIMSNNTV